jgi:hypothetical protein
MQLTLDSSSLQKADTGRDVAPESVPVSGNDPENPEGDLSGDVSLYEY